MANNEEGETDVPRENDWEEVTLTASAYAAAPGPKPVYSSQDSQVKLVGEQEAESSRPMFMSGHFVVFPPSQLKNLPVTPDFTEIQNEKGVADDVSQLVEEEIRGLDVKDGENVSIDELVSDEFGKNVGFDKEQSIYSATEFSSYHSERVMGESNTVEEKAGGTDESTELPDQSLDADSQDNEKSFDGDKYSDDLPCKAWWKRQALSLYDHAKEANTFWSLCIAGAVMGLVIIGHQWQKLHHGGTFGVNDEKMGRIVGPLSRLKDIIIGGHRQGSFVRGSTSAEH